MLDVFLDANAPETLDQHPDGVVREFQHLQHARRAADFVHFFGRGIFGFRFALEHHAEQAIAGDDIIDELGALRRFDQQRRDHSRENDNVRKAEDGQASGQGMAETRAGASGFPAAPRMLINSVSGEVMSRISID